MGAHSRLWLHLLWVWLVTSCWGVAGQATTDQQAPQATVATERENTSKGQADLIPVGYHQEIAPWPQDGSPLLINISIKVNGIVETDERQTAIQIDSYFRVIWEDWRLNYPEEDLDEGVPTIRRGEEGRVRKMIVLPVILDKIWLPDLYIKNVRSIKTMRLLKDVQGVHVYSNNTIFISTWLKIELDCSTTFSKFPFDVQECLLDVLSYMYESPQLKMQWLSRGLVLDPHVGKQLFNYDFEFAAANGNASCVCYQCLPPDPPCVRARLMLSRKAQGHLLATFLPSGLFVAVSWASLFWPADVIPGRTVLLITALLTLVSMHTAVRQSSPETSYVKAVDVWMFMCILLSLLTLFEYLVVLIIKRRHKMKVEQDPALQIRMVRPMSDTVNEGVSQSCHFPHEERLDRAARVFIPTIFLVFNIIYWPYYLII